jgi:hypothetical protein
MVRRVNGPRHFRQQIGEEQRATWLELFFDLVFVFAVTQLSHLLLHHLTLHGALQTLFLLLVVWWAWIYTTWMTNWFDPESVLVRLVLLVVMASSLLMAVAIPEAFGRLAPLFACSYVLLQVARNAFNVYATPRDNAFHVVFLRILAWSLASGVLWLAGGFVGRPHVAVDRGAGRRLRGTVRGLLDAPAGPLRDHRLGDRARALRGAVPAVHHHRAGRVDRRHRRHRIVAGAGFRERDGADGRVRDVGGTVVAVLR